MKIEIVISSDFPEGVSKNSRIKAYALGLKEQGHDVVISVGYSTEFNRNRINQNTVGNWQGIPYTYYSATTVYGTGIWSQFQQWFLANLNFIFHKRRDKNLKMLYYVPTFRSFLLSAFILRVLGRPYITIESELFSLHEKGFRKQLFRFEEWLKSRTADKILVLTRGLQKYYAGYQRHKKVHLITPVSVDMDRFKKKEWHKDIAYRIGYVGTFALKDSLNTIVESYKSAKKDISQLKLFLMGKYNDQKVEAYPGIEYSGFFLYDDLPAMINSCDALVLNRLDDDYSRYGFPIKLAEYLATGIPVILCDFEEYHHYLTQDEVFYFKADNTISLTAEILRRYTEYERANQVGEAGYKACIRLFSKEIAAKELGEILAS